MEIEGIISEVRGKLVSQCFGSFMMVVFLEGGINYVDDIQG